MNEKLKPCPFCGGEAELVKEHFFGGDHYAGRCGNCAATSTFEFTKEEATAEWNRRTNSEIPNNSTCKENLQLIPRWRVCGDVQKLFLNLGQKAKWEFIINTKTLNVMSYIADDDIAISSKEIGTFDTLKDAKTKVNEYIGWIGECMMYFAENIKTERSGE